VVCAGWPYVNSTPHLGTLTQLLSADVYARYLRLKGEEAVLVSGSDEHGAPIEVEALRLGVSPRQLTNRNHQLIKHLLKAFDIQFDNYTRTESRVHREFVQKTYRKIEQNGYIYSQSVILPYCENHQRFLPDRFVEGECPHCHSHGARGDQCDNCGKILEPTDLIKPYCVLCHQTPILKESKHWFFDLPKLSERLRKYVEKNPNFPENARNFSLSWIKEGLKPRSLTRDISWGIPAPFEGAKGKTLYVWMEAVLGYVSATKEWAENNHKPNLWKKFWLDPESRNIHFVGKDNIPFHTIIFPGLLEASGDKYNLPWQVSSTEWIQFEGQKFSKSRRIGVWIDEAIELAGAEYWRYALISLRPELKDANFTWEEFERKINTELNDVLGNFVHRTISFLQTRFRGRVPNYSAREGSDGDTLEVLGQAPKKIEEKLKRFRLKEALEQIIELAREGNRYLNDKEPWKTYKTDKALTGQSLGTSVQILATVGITLQPFLPKSASSILKTLSQKKTPRWNQAGKCFVKPGTQIRSLKPLFHKVSAQDLRAKLEQLRSSKPLEAEA
jgi:methionyl-tRNA synthetase